MTSRLLGFWSSWVLQGVDAQIRVKR
jgi:hypothetical protein